MENIKKYVYNTVVIVLIAVGAIVVILNFSHFGNVEFTDNARVRQHITPQNTRVQGFIKEVRFEEFQNVKKGDTLVVIEDTEFRLRLAQAEADLARVEESSKATGTSIATTDAGIRVTNAGIEEARVNLENAKREDARFEVLLKKDAVTQQQYDNVHTAYLSAKARYEQVAHSRATQTSVKTEQSHHLSASICSLRLAQAAVELARLNLSYCYIIATCDGVVGTKDIEEGMLVQPGQTMVNIVSSNSKWVEANYKESQLPDIHEGSEVEITADAVPGIVYKGCVERISKATGSAFSLVPIDNATGNFVKVEQRVTVRIKLYGNKPEDLAKLHAGYNVECRVKVKK
ncbi:HlyD family secretion protein [Leyella stercorea]|uniref:HlyD family secretion protein n=1 Tax=Leyella stercorea TaxID=363265 RepID=UPI002672BC80|nr:HlyD family secretion protein [Leyella stercorea]